MLDFDAGYIAGYKKAYEEIILMAKQNIQKNTISNPIKGAEGLGPTGPTGYVGPYDNRMVGANGPIGPYN